MNDVIGGKYGVLDGGGALVMLEKGMKWVYGRQFEDSGLSLVT